MKVFNDIVNQIGNLEQFIMSDLAVLPVVSQENYFTWKYFMQEVYKRGLIETVGHPEHMERIFAHRVVMGEEIMTPDIDERMVKLLLNGK